MKFNLLIGLITIQLTTLIVLADTPQAPEVEEIVSQAPDIEQDNKDISTTQAPVLTDTKWLSPEEMPETAEWFKGTKTTQSIYVGVDTEGTRWNYIDKIDRAVLDPKWQMSGGMLGITGWKSDKFRTIPDNKEVLTSVEYKDVWNGSNFQKNKGIVRKYPVGTRFDDILSSKRVVRGKVVWTVFEHRMRHKEVIEGKERWVSEVIYENKEARPRGYNGLSVSCGSCHSEAGTGNYGEGLIPGGDTIISDPLDWSVWQTN